MSSFVKFSSKLEIMLAYNYTNDKKLWTFDTISDSFILGGENRTVEFTYLFLDGVGRNFLFPIWVRHFFVLSRVSENKVFIVL